MRQYVNSGKFRIGPVLLWTLVGLAAGAVISVIYTAIANWNPLIYLNFLVLIGVIYALTWAVLFIVKKSQSRNKAVNLAVTFLICLFSWYVGWTALMSYMFEASFFALLVRPGAVFEMGLYYAQNVGMTLNDNEIPAGMLMFFYGLEFLAYFYPMILVAQEKLYYCEFCEGYMKPKDLFISNKNLVEENLGAIRSGNLSFMEQVEVMQDKLNTEVPEQYKLNLHTCPGCQDKVYNFYHLRMKHKKGKYEVANTQTLVRRTYAIRNVEEQ